MQCDAKRMPKYIETKRDEVKNLHSYQLILVVYIFHYWPLFFHCNLREFYLLFEKEIFHLY